MKDGQDKIYFASGDSIEQIELLPQVESVTKHGYEVLYLTEDIDEFAVQMLFNYSEKEFLNVCRDDLDLSTDEEKESLREENEKAKDLFAFIRESIGADVKEVRFTNSLDKHPVCLASEGMLSYNMQKTLDRMPGNEDGMMKAELVLEINLNHPITQKLKNMFENEEMHERLKAYSKILYANARLISGLNIENAAEFGSLVSDILTEA